MPSFRVRALILAIGFFCPILAVSPLVAGEHCHGESQPAIADPELGEATELRIPETPLTDHQGRSVQFGRDLIEGKVVALNFVFTTCTTVCPPMGANFGKLQDLLGERAGRDVHLVSLSIDPTVDTPERLAAWGSKFGAAEGWTLVTGEKPIVDDLLRHLGVFVAEKTFHSPIVLLGNAVTGEWRRANGLTPADSLLEQLDALASDGATTVARSFPTSPATEEPAP